ACPGSDSGVLGRPSGEEFSLPGKTAGYVDLSGCDAAAASGGKPGGLGPGPPRRVRGTCGGAPGGVGAALFPDEMIFGSQSGLTLTARRGHGTLSRGMAPREEQLSMKR